ncbi:MAG: hypothetical protein LUF30_10215 [Lachnospiraceae bacterium]|nr:hypothetical protein [Lachnospiraceae bacterium]
MSKKDPDSDAKAAKKSKGEVNTPYDDVFRTLLNDCKTLVLPVLNEVFGENYTGDEKIVYSKNEHYLNQQDGTEDKRITDSGFTVVGEGTKKYLFECQSNSDRSMLVRIFEYATQIALDDGEIVANTLKVTIPDSAVLYLRSNKSTPDKLQIEITTPGGSVTFDVHVMKMKEYSLEDIFEKHLLFLLPFYIFKYENRKLLEELEEDAEKLEALKNEYRMIVGHLNKLTDQGRLSVYYRRILLEMSGKVIEGLAGKYAKVMEGVKSIMGGTVLEYEAKNIYREGEAAGYRNGEDAKAKKMALSLHKSGVDDDLIAKAANVSVEIVKSWIALEPA